jgi:hypothetical protein
MIAFFSRLLCWLLFCASLFAANVLPPATWGYDARAQLIDVYDGGAIPHFYYDYVSTPSANEKANRPAGTSAVLARPSEFLAAESGGFTTLYHGTSSEAAAAIRANGIDLSFSRANLDFGKGFYTTTDLGQAQAWAARQGGEVLTFNVPNSQLSQLSHLQFPGANGAWADFVGANRGGASLHGFDAVSGPMLGNPRAFMNGASPTAFGQQMSFHSDAAVNLLNNSLLP